MAGGGTQILSRCLPVLFLVTECSITWHPSNDDDVTLSDAVLVGVSLDPPGGLCCRWALPRLLLSHVIFYQGNHIFWLPISSFLLPQPTAVVVSPLRFSVVKENKIMNARKKGNRSFFLAFQFYFCQMTLEELEPVNALSKEPRLLLREELGGNAAATTKVCRAPSDLGTLWRALAVIIYTPCLIQSTCLSYKRHSVDVLLSSSQWACCEFVSNAVNNDKVVHQ